jgi:hypothetical protein
MPINILDSELSKYLVLAAMLAATLFGYFRGRDAAGGNLFWTHIPLIALAIVSIGPSVLATLIYLGYTTGLIAPDPAGYRFSIFVQDAPLEFAVINWAFVALYVACRLRPKADGARLAMWLSVLAMSLPNVVLFGTAWEMVSNARGAGQGIGIMEAILIVPLISFFWSGPIPGIFSIGFGIGFVLSAVTAIVPLLGLIGWLAGRLLGKAAARAAAKPV